MSQVFRDQCCTTDYGRYFMNTVTTFVKGEHESSLLITYIPPGSNQQKVRSLPKGMSYEDFVYIQKQMFEGATEEALEWLLEASDEEINRAIVMGKLSGL